MVGMTINPPPDTDTDTDTTAGRACAAATCFCVDLFVCLFGWLLGCVGAKNALV